MSKPWHSQDHISLLFSDYINLHSFLMSLIINIHFYHIFYWSFFVQHFIHISYIYWSFYFFNLNLYFLANSELITSPIALLSNSISTIISSYISILSKPIFTITSLNMFPLSRLYVDVFSTTLESITNLLLLRPSQELPDFLLHLNYLVCYFLQFSISVYIPVFYPPQFCFLFPYSCSF